MPINIDDLKKKIIYRSSYRGTKEMDSLLSSFTKKYIDTFTRDELINLSNLLEIDDETLYKYHVGQKMNKKVEDNKVSRLFKNFIYE
jgi:antitoxin CptB